MKIGLKLVYVTLLLLVTYFMMAASKPSMKRASGFSSSNRSSTISRTVIDSSLVRRLQRRQVHEVQEFFGGVLNDHLSKPFISAIVTSSSTGIGLRGSAWFPSHMAISWNAW